MRRVQRAVQMGKRAAEILRLYDNWPVVYRNRLAGRDAKGLVTYHLRAGVSMTVAAGHEDIAIINDIWLDRPYEAPDVKPRQGWTVVDVGSNKGSFSVRAAYLADGRLRRLVCVEPEPRNYECLVRNVPDSAAQQVHRLNVAVGSERGTVMLYRVHGSSGQHSLHRARAAGQGQYDAPVEVEKITLEDVLSYCPEGVDLLKLDCEGAEYDIVLNSPAAWFSSIARITMEYDERDPLDGHRGVEVIEERLSGLGYSVKLRSAGQASGHILDAVR